MRLDDISNVVGGIRVGPPKQSAARTSGRGSKPRSIEKPSTSSLDFQVGARSRGRLLTTAAAAATSTRATQENQNQGSSKERQAQEHSGDIETEETETGPKDQQPKYRLGRSTATRARGSSGPPPKKYELSDLQGMSEEQIIRALREDPDLAALATQASKKTRGYSDGSSPSSSSRGNRRKNKPSNSPTSSPSSSSSSSSRGSRYYRKSDGSVKAVHEHPQHLREMMEGGVPFLQWAFIASVLLFSLYQFRNSFRVTEPQSHPRMLRKKARKKLGSDKKTPRKAVQRSLPVESLSEDQPKTADALPIPDHSIDTPDDLKSRKKRRRRHKSTSQRPSISSDEVDDTQTLGDGTDSNQNTVAEINRGRIFLGVKGSSERWQKVGSKVSSRKSESRDSSAQNGEAKTNVNATEKPTIPENRYREPKSVSHTPHDELSNADAELAMKLQLAEKQLSGKHAPEEVWEEVVSREKTKGVTNKQ